MTVVGIAADVLNRRLTESPQPILYRTLEQSSDLSLALLIRTRGDATALGEGVAREVRAVDPSIPIYSVRTMPEILDAAVAQRRFLMRLLVAFGSVATLLALLGAYGVMSYSVSQRRREIGIRMAFGARHVDVMRMIMLQGMTITSAGILSGIVVALALMQLVRSQLYGVKPSDPLTIAAVLLLMVCVAGIAAYLPARRAVRVDPMNVLRSL
jgi:ABC-type antimicrobial peptide transport system permease subunit